MLQICTLFATYINQFTQIVPDEYLIHRKPIYKKDENDENIEITDDDTQSNDETNSNNATNNQPQSSVIFFLFIFNYFRHLFY